MAKPSYEEYMAAQRAKVEQRVAERDTADVKRELKPASMVGLDLGLCVADILNGTIKETSVRTIFLAGSIEEELEKSISRCKGVLWAKDPKRGEAIARKLFEDGKIKEPAEGQGAVTMEHWIRVEQRPESTEEKERWIERHALD